MVVMSPERYNFLVHLAERDRLSRDAIPASRAGARGVPAREAIRAVADEFGRDPAGRDPSGDEGR